MARVLRTGGEHLRRRSSWWRRLLFPSAGRYRAGLEGERRVAAVLDGLPGRFRVLHDIRVPGGGNLDHVVVGPRGLVVVETKYHAADIRGRAGGQWRRREPQRGWRAWVPGGWSAMQDPTVQAWRAAERLEEALAPPSGFPVTPMVVFAHPRGRVRARSPAVRVVDIRRLRRAVRRSGRRGALSRREVRDVADRVLALHTPG